MHKCENKPDGMSHYHHVYDSIDDKYRHYCHYCKNEVELGKDENDAQRPDNGDT